jgi:hypothetical protein
MDADECRDGHDEEVQIPDALRRIRWRGFEKQKKEKTAVYTAVRHLSSDDTPAAFGWDVFFSGEVSGRSVLL